VIVEIKATENDHPVYKAQVLTYLKLTGLKLGLVLNFGKCRLIDGYSRVVNDF
jgi:GxxExxY protein